jgi:hypothetical protein
MPALDALREAELGFTWARRLNEWGIFTHLGHAPGLDLSFWIAIEANPAHQTIFRAFEFVPALEFRLHVDPLDCDKEGEAIGLLTMLRACSALLNTLPGDAVLVTETGELVLQRRNGTVFLNTEWGFWSPYRISQIHVSHSLRNLSPTLAAAR